jgi:hypothetical protein
MVKNAAIRAIHARPYGLRIGLIAPRQSLAGAIFLTACAWLPKKKTSGILWP